MTMEAPPQHSQATRHLSVNGPIDVSGHVTKLPHPPPQAQYHRSFSAGQHPSGLSVGVAQAVHAPSSGPHHSQLPLRGVVRSGTPPTQSSPQLSAVPPRNQSYAKTMANPDPKPAILSVPLPSAPLTASILDSLDGGAVGVGVSESGPPSGPGGNISGDPLMLGGSGGAKTLEAAVHGKQAPPTVLGGVALQSQQLQKVIEAQKSQIALLQEISQYVSANSKGLSKTPPTGGSGGGRYQGVGQGLGQATPNVGGASAATATLAPSRVLDRAQTFDYGNHSNRSFELKAVQQIEEDRYYDNEGRWP